MEYMYVKLQSELSIGSRKNYRFIFAEIYIVVIVALIRITKFHFAYEAVLVL